jgi:hypothetical protein
MKSSPVVSYVSMVISSQFLTKGVDEVYETLETNSILSRLIVLEDFIAFSGRVASGLTLCEQTSGHRFCFGKYNK